MSVSTETSSPRSAVTTGLNAQRQDERRRAIAALLRRPLLTSGGRDGDALLLVRRHAPWLRDWFTKYCGWTLHVESELARLRKTPGDVDDPTRALLDSKGEPFTRRRYVLLCLALAALERCERQTVLRRLADDIVSAVTSDPQLAQSGITFDLALREHRRDLVEVIKHLIDLNVVTRVDGEEQQFIASGQQDVLYNINVAALAFMLNVRRGPSTITAQSTDDRIRVILDELYPDTEDGRNRRLRTRLFRRLIDDPLLYYAQLDDEERGYLIPQRPSIVKELKFATGLVQETRREGIAMIDPADAMTDVGMPEEGTNGHATLLVAEHLATRLRNGITESLCIIEIERYAESLIRDYGKHWRNDVAVPGAATLLTREALRRLRMLRLIDLNENDHTVVPLPAIGRFALGAVRDSSSKDDDPPLWS